MRLWRWSNPELIRLIVWTQRSDGLGYAKISIQHFISKHIKDITCFGILTDMTRTCIWPKIVFATLVCWAHLPQLRLIAQSLESLQWWWSRSDRTQEVTHPKNGWFLPSGNPQWQREIHKFLYQGVSREVGILHCYVWWLESIHVFFPDFSCVHLTFGQFNGAKYPFCIWQLENPPFR